MTPAEALILRHERRAMLLKAINEGQSIDPIVRYVGAVMGRTHEWNKGADKPYIVIRELNGGELIKCSYSDDDYASVAKIFGNKSAVVIVDGQMTFNRITSKTEITMASGFEFAPDFSDNDYEKFFGSAPGLTGDLSAADYISKGRDEH